MTLLTPLVACRKAAPQGTVRAPEPTPTSEAVPAVPAQAAPAPTLLAPSSPLDRLLLSGETHRFRVDLGTDQVLDLRVEQHGVDVVVTLLGPRGDLLLEVDNPNGVDGTRGVERVVWIAQTPGTYILAIRCWGREGAAGAYQIELEEPRLAMARDRERVVAEQAKAEADQLYMQHTPDSRKRAIGRYQKALAGFMALNDPVRQADTHYRLGTSWRLLGDKESAFEEFEMALPLYEAAGNGAQQALCRHELCVLLESRGELESALGHCLAALRLWESVGDQLGTARTAHELGYVYRSLNEGHRALTLYDRARDLNHELGLPAKEAQTLHNRGRLYAALGQRARALADLEMALLMRQRLAEEPDIALSLNSLGLLHARWQDMEAARDYFSQALALRQAMRQEHVGITLLGLGWSHLGSDGARSADYLQQALEIFRREGATSWQAQTLLLSAQQQQAARDPSRLPDTLTLALELFEAAQDRAGTAETRLAIANAWRHRGQLPEAQREIEKALEIIEDLRTRAAASLDQRAGFLATKQTYYELYVDLLMERHEERPTAGFDAAALAASERARARSLIEALSERRDGTRWAVDAGLLEEEQRLQRRIGALQIQIETQPKGVTAGHAARLAQLTAEQHDLLRRYDKLQGEIRLRNPHYADLTQPELSSLEDIQRMIGPETLLLEYSLGESRSFLWAVTSDQITSVELPARVEIETLTRRVVGLISHEQQTSTTRSRRRAEQALAELGHWLLGEVQNQLGTARRLLIVADGALQYLPFEALPVAGGDPSDPEATDELISDLDEIVYLPSASTLAVLRRQLADRQPAPQLLAVLADPVFTEDDPRYPRPGPAAAHPEVTRDLERLIHTAGEAQAILALVPPGRRFAALGFAANRDVLTSGELGRYRIVHLATHGQINTEHAELSRLVLSRFDAQGQPRNDSFLYAYEAFALQLPVELVVLSACQTALGEHIRGEGLVGLTRGFMHAGAARVVVSLWRVEDQATAALMGLFYHNLLVQGMPPAAALRAAKNSIRQEKAWRDPYYWAGFIFQGEWKDFPKQT